MLPNAGEDVEKLGHSYFAGGNVNWAAAAKNSMAVSYKPKHTLTIQSQSWAFTREK